MSDTEHNQEEMLEQGQDQLFKLQLRFKKDTILEVSLSGKDCFMELRTYVTELPDLFFHSSFHFQHDGKQINE